MLLCLQRNSHIACSLEDRQLQWLQDGIAVLQPEWLVQLLSNIDLCLHWATEGQDAATGEALTAVQSELQVARRQVGHCSGLCSSSSQCSKLFSHETSCVFYPFVCHHAQQGG